MRRLPCTRSSSKIADPRRPTPIALASPAVLGLSVDVSHDCPSSLLPGATCSIALRASATEFARAAGALQLSSDAHSQALLVPLSYAVGSVPSGRLSLSLSPGVVDFGTAAAQTSVVREFSLHSHGSAPVTLGVAAITGPGAGAWVLGGDCVAERVLDPGSACNVRLTWTAGAPGPAEAAVQWRSSGASPGTVSLFGRSTAAAVSGAAAAPPDATASQPVGGSGGGSIGVGFVALLALAALALVIDRSRQRHAHVTRAS